MVLSLVISMAFALDNTQKIYDVNSDVYTYMKYLYIDQGHALPSSTGPWNSKELLGMLDKIDSSKLSEGLKSAYDYVFNILNEDLPTKESGIENRFSFDLNIEGYFHTNDSNTRAYKDVGAVREYAFENFRNWAFDDVDQKPFFDLKWESFAGNNFYTYFDFNLMNSWHDGDRYEKEIGSQKLSSNILLLKHMELNSASTDANYPFRAFIATGGDVWSFQIGRDRLSWGNGETGNLVISDNLPYHNMARLTLFSNNYK